MARERTVLRALASTAVPVPVPRVIRTCEDPGILGAPFYLMERLDGIVFRTARDVAHLDEAQSRACANELADVLATLHAKWEAAKFADVPEIDEVARRLAASVPPPAPAAVVHGDYSFNNCRLLP